MRILVLLVALAGLAPLLQPSVAVAQGCNQYFEACMAGNKAACPQYEECIGGLINSTLDRTDPPELRRLRYLCQEGDMRACDAEIVWRNSIVRGYDAAIGAMNRQFGPSWRQSFGLGG